MILFEWGTYNAKSTLKQAALLGTRITEIPPAVLSRRYSEEYYLEYKELVEKYFTFVLAHGPYYNVLSEKGLKAHLDSINRAKLCGAKLYNFHLGKRTGNDDLINHLEVLKSFYKECPEMIFSPEPSHNYNYFGSLNELEELVIAAKEENIKIIPSLQLENIFLNEFGIYETGDFETASEKATKEWWLKVFDRMSNISEDLIHLRFSQVIGIMKNNFLYKKRVPLKMGYPFLEPLTDAISTFLVRNALDPNPKKIIFVYTGIPETKYVDLIEIYTLIMKKSVNRLMNRKEQLEEGDFYKIMSENYEN